MDNSIDIEYKVNVPSWVLSVSIFCFVRTHVVCAFAIDFFVAFASTVFRNQFFNYSIIISFYWYSYLSSHKKKKWKFNGRWREGGWQWRRKRCLVTVIFVVETCIEYMYIEKLLMSIPRIHTTIDIIKINEKNEWARHFISFTHTQMTYRLKATLSHKHKHEIISHSSIRFVRWYCVLLLHLENAYKINRMEWYTHSLVHTHTQNVLILTQNENVSKCWWIWIRYIIESIQRRRYVMFEFNRIVTSQPTKTQPKLIEYYF